MADDLSDDEFFEDVSMIRKADPNRTPEQEAEFRKMLRSALEKLREERSKQDNQHDK